MLFINYRPQLHVYAKCKLFFILGGWLLIKEVTRLYLASELIKFHQQLRDPVSPVHIAAMLSVTTGELSKDMLHRGCEERVSNKQLLEILKVDVIRKAFSKVEELDANDLLQTILKSEKYVYGTPGSMPPLNDDCLPALRETVLPILRLR